jgi:hypothetical protein
MANGQDGFATDLIQTTKITGSLDHQRRSISENKELPSEDAGNRAGVHHGRGGFELLA